MLLFTITFLVVFGRFSVQQELPVKTPVRSADGGSNGACPADEVLTQLRNKTSMDVQSILKDTVLPAFNNQNDSPQCPCGGSGPWRKIAHLNMNDPNQQCPTNWRLVTSPVRACARSTLTGPSCDSAVFSSEGTAYSHVCGRVNAIQRGTPEAFYASIDGRNPGLDASYIDGVSLTHGAAGSRQHIWSFVAAQFEQDSIITSSVCPCTNTQTNWGHQIQPYIGNSYFCDTGDSDPGVSLAAYPDDPLWDGEGCGPTSSCCQFNTPPWFCVKLEAPTTDDIELRICLNQGAQDESIEVTLVEIFTQ